MTVSSQRFMSFYLGNGKINKLKSIFNISILLHLILGICVVILLEIAGFFIFNGFLEIPLERINSAKIIFHFYRHQYIFYKYGSFDAVINAHENMLFDSIVGIFLSFGKLGIAIWLLFIKDKLIVYGLLFLF